jgi:hypothetical protein
MSSLRSCCTTETDVICGCPRLSYICSLCFVLVTMIVSFTRSDKVRTNDYILPERGAKPSRIS